MAEKKVIQIALDGDIEKLSAKIKTIQSELGKLSLGQNLNKEFEETFYSLTNELKKIQGLTTGNKINFIDIKKVEKSADIIDELYDKILHLSKSSGIESSFLKNDKKAIDALAKARASYNSKTSEGLKEQQRLEKKLAEAKEKTNSKLIKAQAIDKTREETTKRLEEAQRELASLEKQLREKGGNNPNKYLKTDPEGKVISADKRTSLGKQYNALKEQLPDLQKEAEKAEKAIRPTLAQINEEAIKMANNITKAQKALDDFNKTQPQSQANAFKEVRQELEKIDGIDWKTLGIDLNSINSIDELNEKLSTLSTDAGVRARQVLENIVKASSDGVEPLKAFGRSVQSAGQDVKELTDRQRDIQRLTDQLKNFFSISNSVQLFKRAVRSAFETVKELDSAMTEIAVVSDFSVGDMWEKLPQFTAQANELGVAIKDTYNATALYIQQGLDLQHSMELSNETLKMARIAGMEAADATDAMTSALRGFNMELSQTSAQRVNDVYSELAAITASDVQELSTAMSKTASIAHNVNMEFETTAAFLAQGVETTRESAETIGTALKTVIGRFSEVKSLYTKGELTGTDENGEEINVNKVQKALRSAGVDMTKFFTGEEGLDQVFLDLSKKWDSLDITTQRYIATLAAGSRQQSRFIAMISNYSKTMELVNAANNSAGASQEQYEKTLESLASKLNKLKNAWDEFAMGLANNEVIKVAVDTLTALLQTINKILDTVSGGSSVLKSTLSILTAIGGLKLGKSLLSTGIGKMVGEREGGLAEKLFGKKKEQQNTGYSAGIQTGKGFINGFESITKTFKLKGGKGFIQSIFSAERTVTDFSKDLEKKFSSKDWKFDFSNAKPEGLATLKKNIVDNLSKGNEEYQNLGVQFNQLWDNGQYDEAMNALDQAHIKINMTGKDLQDMGASARRTVPNFQAMAIATGAAATALMALGAYLETTGEGGEKAGKVIQGLGTMLMGTIPIISMVQAAMIAGAESVSVAIKNIPIIGWIAAIISAVISLIQIISALAPETKEEKLKRLSEQTQQAAEAAKEAQQAYENLQESFDKYSDATDKIKKLTVGTTEWKEALLEVNAEVLSLLEKYPQLSNYVISENGVMSIRPEGIQKILDQALQTSYSAQALQISNDFIETSNKKQANKENFENQSAFYKEDFYNQPEPVNTDAIEKFFNYLRDNPSLTKEELKGKAISISEAQKLSYEELREILKANIEGLGEVDIKNIIDKIINAGDGTSLSDILPNSSDKLYLFTKEMQEFSKEAGVSAISLAEMTDKTKDFNQTQMSFEVQQESYKRGVSVLAGPTSGQEYWNEALNIIDLDKTAERIEQVGKDLNQTDLVDIAKQLNNQGAEVVVSDNTDEILKSIYETITGDKSGTKTESQMKEQVAQYKVMKEQASEVGKVAEKLSNIEDKEIADEITARLSHGKELTRTQAEKAINLEAMATAMGYGSTDEMAKAFNKNTATELEESWTEEASKIESQFGQIETDVISVIGGAAANQAKGLMGDQTFETYSNYLDQLSVLFIRSGDEGAKAVEQFQNAFDQILSGLSDENKKKVQEIVGNIDFSSYDSVARALEDIQEVAPNSTESLEEMKGAVVDLGKASKKVDLKGALSSITDALNLADDIASRDKSEGITQEELETIVSSGAKDYSDFIFTGQEFIPVEDSMDSLAEAIRNNSLEVIKNTQALLQSSIQSGEVLESAFNSNKWGNTTDEQKNRILSGNADMNLGDAEVLRDLLRMKDTDSDYAVMSAYNAHIFDYLNLADNRAQDEAYTNYADQMKAFQLDPQEQLDQGGAYLKERVEAQELSNLQKEITEDFQESNPAIKANTKLIEAHTLRYAQAEKKVKSFCETIKDVKEAFDVGTKALKNNEKPSEDYYKALEKISEKGKQIFGDSFTKEFVEENADLISQLSEGGEIGEQAFISLQQKISESVKKSLTDLLGLEAETSQIKSILRELDGVNAQFAINGTADVSQLMNSLIAAGQTAEEAAKTIEALTGSTVTFNVEKQVITVPAGQVYNVNGKYAGAKVLGGMSGFVSIEIPKAIATKSTYSGSGFSSGSSGGGSGGSSSKEKVWENPYDKLYNLTEEINEALRQREALEREYDRILERRGSTFKEIRANYNAQLSSLEHELKLQKQLQEGRKEQLDAIANERYTDSGGNRKTFAQTGATRYARYDQSLNRIIIDWDAIDMITDDDLGSAVEAYVSRLEELQDQFEEIDKTVEDMQDTVNELKKAQMQDYLDFEQSVYDALVNAQQKLIDEYQSLSDSIADSNSKILDNLQESIDLERQIRDNTKTEEDINEKEARLAFLRRDTSNANALEIKQLEEELSDARQDYSDNLIDQQLDRLSKQNDDAQEAREKQIELMQAQLDYASENGEFWNQAYELINDGFSSDGSLNQASQLWDLLKADQGWNGLSKFGQLNWQEEISKAIIAASQGYANWNMYKAEQVDKSLVLPNGTQLIYDGTNWKDSQGNIYKNVDFNSNKNQFEYGSIDYVKPAPTPDAGGSSSSFEPEKKEISVGSSFNASGAPIYSYPGSSAQRQYFANDPYYVAIGEMGDYWMARWHGASSGVTGFFKKSDVRAYKTGGLADFTGPAWLDGSKTKPELVLNARDTENFLLLKDVLGSFIKNNPVAQNSKGGDNYYDINISVDEIGSDYDVDQLARRIKEQITEDSTYRNVNAINFIR